MLKKVLIALAVMSLEGCTRKKEPPVQQEVQKALFVTLPDLLVNLVQTGPRRNYLKLSLVVEVKENEASKKIEQVLPKIVDRLQVFLRTLRISDLEGSIGLPRLKAHLKAEVNMEIKPYTVQDVLFKEVIIQ